MKKIILIIAIIALSYSCSSSDDSNSSNDNPSNGNVNYEFTITINGEVHKVEGNTTNGIPIGSVNAGLNYINNECEVLNNGGQNGCLLKLMI
jgi:hypothetical protein